MKIEEVIEECLVAIFNEDIFRETLYLKGGQAMRFAEENASRFSSDVDFSIESSLDDPNYFFKILNETIYAHFDSIDLHVFDFKFKRKPEVSKEGYPDFWTGWEVHFKIIEKVKKILPLDKMRREAIRPEGANSTQIELEISQYEYCKSIQKVKVRGSEIKSYSRSLLILEKLRALCQQHPDYKYRGTRFRARDFYDISGLIYKYTKSGERKELISECKKHLDGVFMAKEVPISILHKITEPEFVEIQKRNWEQVVRTISGEKESYEYYVGTVKDFIKQIIDT